MCCHYSLTVCCSALWLPTCCYCSLSACVLQLLSNCMYNVSVILILLMSGRVCSHSVTAFMLLHLCDCLCCYCSFTAYMSSCTWLLVSAVSLICVWLQHSIMCLWQQLQIVAPPPVYKLVVKLCLHEDWKAPTTKVWEPLIEMYKETFLL